MRDLHEFCIFLDWVWGLTHFYSQYTSTFLDLWNERYLDPVGRSLPPWLARMRKRDRWEFDMSTL